MARLATALYTALVLLAAASSNAQAPPPKDTIIVPDQQTQARFAVPDCIPRQGDDRSREACRAVTQALRKDLEFEGAFKFVPESLMNSIPRMNPDAPNWIDWRSTQADYLIVSRAGIVGEELTVEVNLFYVASGQSMMAKRYAGRPDNPRIFAHQGSDDIMTLTPLGRGVARTKIAFVSDRDATRDKPTKELYIVDYDGFNPRRVTVNRSLNILPAWSPDGRSLAYTSYRTGIPDIFIAQIYEGKSSNLTGGKASSFAAAFSPDGKRVAYSSTRGGSSEIWVANVDGSGAHRLSSSSGSDTAPFWSPTGQELAFTSSRSGVPQIYLMDSEGLNVRRLTTVGNYNDAPAWNPSKQWSEIAYTSRLEGGFEVAVVDLVTRQVRQITQGRGSCEYPSWAPSGRHLVFSCRQGATWQLVVADRLGANVRTLATGSGNNVQPDWGP